MSSPVGTVRKPRGEFARWNAPPHAAKLTRRHRDAARLDHHYAEALRLNTMYPQRIDALIAGRAWFEGRGCSRCGESRRRVYNCECWTCMKNRTPLKLDHRNRLREGWLSVRSRDGLSAIRDEKRRRDAGEPPLEYRDAAGLVVVYVRAGGLTRVVMPSAGIDVDRFEKLTGREVGLYRGRYPAIDEALYHAWG